MPTGYQIKDQTAAYYLTFQVVYWIDLFTRKSYRDIVIESLKYCQKEKELEIYAWVIMSNHIHIIIRSNKGELSNAIRDFKKYTSKRIIDEIEQSAESRKGWILRLFAHAAKRQNKTGKYQVWTHENHAIELLSNSFIQQKVEYLHNNPVRAGMVDYPEEYKYSSAKAYTGEEGLLDIIPVVLEWKTVK
ncbi:MAG TPA: transposase [Bacteroidia bacterium]|nr:transposase [Bacteroidia bacterium]